MDSRNKTSENWPVNGLSKQVSPRDGVDIKRTASRMENKHHRIRQTRSLDQAERHPDRDGRNVDFDVKDKTRKHHASEKIRKSASSKYKSEGTATKQVEHKGNVYRDNKERTNNLQFINAYDFSEEQNTKVKDEGKQLRKKPSVIDSLKSSESSNLSKKNSNCPNSKQHPDESRHTKVARQDSADERKRQKQVVRHSSASPETSSNELQSPKKRKSRSKRKEIHKTQPTFYGLAETEFALPLATTVMHGKRDKRKIPKTGASVITSNFTVLETGEINSDRRRGTLFIIIIIIYFFFFFHIYIYIIWASSWDYGTFCSS